MKKLSIAIFVIFSIFFFGITILILGRGMFMGTYLYIVQPNKIAGLSMEPTYKDGSYIFTEKLTYKKRDPEIGDVIIFHHPIKKNIDYIQRIIALSGEELMIVKGNVYINNKLLSEDYLQEDTRTVPGDFIEEGEVVRIPSGYYFVMNDNRNVATDSRDWGLVPRENIVGKASICYWNCPSE